MVSQGGLDKQQAIMKLILVTLLLFTVACRKAEIVEPPSDNGDGQKAVTTTAKTKDKGSASPMASILEVFHTGRGEDSVKLKHGELIFNGDNAMAGLKELTGTLDRAHYLVVYYNGNMPLPLEEQILSEINSNRDKRGLETVFINIYDGVDPLSPLDCPMLFELEDGKGFIFGGRFYGSSADLLAFVKNSNIRQLAISADDNDPSKKILTDLKSLVNYLVLGNSDPQFPVETFHDPGFVLPE